MVTAALLDMFCGLNGRTRNPRSAKTRHKPAVMSDFPTFEPVPMIMIARAAMVSDNVGVGAHDAAAHRPHAAQALAARVRCLEEGWGLTLTFDRGMMELMTAKMRREGQGRGVMERAISEMEFWVAEARPERQESSHRMSAALLIR